MTISPYYDQDIADFKQRAEKLGNPGVSAFLDAQTDLREFWGCEVVILGDLEKRLDEIEKANVTFTHG